MTSTRSPKKAEKRAQEHTEAEDRSDGHEQHVEKKKRRRKTRDTEAEAMPLAARTPGLRMFIGAHVSASGGVHRSVDNALLIG
jgi:AP endonuclease 1